MKDLAYYRDLIMRILTEEQPEPVPSIPNRSEIEKRKIAHLVKMKRLPNWLQTAKISKGLATLGEYSGMELNRGWTLEEWEFIAAQGDPNITVSVWLSSGYPLDPPSDQEITGAMNQILSQFFNTVIDDCSVIEDYSEITSVVNVHSAKLEQLVFPWLEQLWK